jgi:hypothetical protein
MAFYRYQSVKTPDYTGQEAFIPAIESGRCIGFLGVPLRSDAASRRFTLQHTPETRQKAEVK